MVLGPFERGGKRTKDEERGRVESLQGKRAFESAQRVEEDQRRRAESGGGVQEAATSRGGPRAGAPSTSVRERVAERGKPKWSRISLTTIWSVTNAMMRMRPWHRGQSRMSI